MVRQPTRRAVGDSSDLTDEEWEIVEPMLRYAGKRGRRHGADLRKVVDAILYVSKTGCQWRMLPSDFGPWTRVWTQFRRGSANGTWSWMLAELHVRRRLKVGREPTPSMVVVDSHMARGASQGRPHVPRPGRQARVDEGRQTCRDRRCHRSSCHLPTSVHDNGATAAVLDELHQWGSGERLELVLVDRGVTEKAARRIGAGAGVEVRLVGWDTPLLDEDGRRAFRPILHAWRVEVAHGRIGRARRLSKSFEKTTSSASGWLQVACVMLVLRAP